MLRSSHLTLVLMILMLGAPALLIAAEMERAAPAEVGLDAARLERINAFAQRYVDEEKLPGIITAVARRGKIIHLEAVGYKDIEEKSPLALDSIFRIYSMSKPITSVAVMILYEEGKLRLNAPVSDYIPEFKDLKVLTTGADGHVRQMKPKRPVTVQDLLRHTSGLSYGFFSDTYVDDLYRDTEVLGQENTLQGMIEKLAKLPLLFQPGERWHYGVSTDVLGYLVEVVSGQPFDVFLQERVFDPLGMTDTGFFVPAEKLGRLTTCYGPDRDAMKNSNGKIVLKAIDRGKESRLGAKPKGPSGGGGLASTAHDYLRFLQMLLNKGELDGKRILSAKTVEYMTIDHLPSMMDPDGKRDLESRGYGFGLGFAVLKNPAGAGVVTSAGEYNWSGYASTLFWVDPKEEIIGMLLTQFIPSGTYPLDSDMRTAVYQSIIE